ncbi:MAG TPA: hypothetical protein VEL76_19210 [Gemmataceae bacterium]|nr:hypothetical protein [Gemmataceae bacterium]
MADSTIRHSDPDRLQQLGDLLTIARAAGEWARKLRTFLPIADQAWPYAACGEALLIVLNGAVGVEKLLNPEAGNPVCSLEGRLTVEVVVGPGIRSREFLVATQGLLNSYDAILAHCCRLRHDSERTAWLLRPTCPRSRRPFALPATCRRMRTAPTGSPPFLLKSRGTGVHLLHRGPEKLRLRRRDA